MYFRKVNRGVAFTKAGLYTTGFVILVGFVASGSGYNGLFLAVGYGLSVLTISGLLSERIMKNYEFVGLREATADAGEPFEVPMIVRNQSDSWSVFGMENLCFETLPRLKIWPAPLVGVIENRLLVLEPGQSVELAATCHGLPRGVHTEFQVVQRTLYPFGLLLKFKVTPTTTKIRVLPPVNESLARELTAEIRQRLMGTLSDQDFRFHRPMTSQDSVRLVDWKKSAGLAVENWSVKVYEAPTPEFGILIDVDWEALLRSPDAATYEAELSAARTACDVARGFERNVTLNSPRGGVFTGYERCVEALAAVPPHAERGALSQSVKGEAGQPGTYLRLKVGAGSHHWDSTPVIVRAGVA